MAHKCFISFKTEDSYYKEYIQKNFKFELIDRSLNEAIDSDDEDYIMRKIREDYLSDSTVTLILIGLHSSEDLGWKEQKFIKRELQASLYNSPNYKKSGILGVVLPNMSNSIYKGSGICTDCGNNHNYVHINNSTVIREFSYNYYIPHDKCAWAPDDRYCILVSWENFVENPELYIDQAFQKRDSPIATKTKVRP